MGVAVALEGFTPLQIATIRITGAAAILVLYAWLSGREMPGKTGSKRIWLHILGFALFSNVIPFSLLGWGMTHVASGFAGVTMAVVPLLVLPLAHFLVPGDRLTPIKTFGFLLGFVGTVVLIGPDAFVSAGGDLEGLARLACVAASASYAFGAINTRLAPPTGMIAYSAATLAVASLIMIPIMVTFDGIPTLNFDRATLAAIYLAVFLTAIATLMMVSLIRGPGPSFLSLVNYQVPIWSVAFGTILLGELLPPSLFAALLLILVGLAISQFGTRRG